MKRILLLLCLLLPALASAQDVKPLQLDVSGEIAIDHQGAVYDYKIHTILTPEVKKIVEDSVRQWRFEPVQRDGKPVYAKSGMFLTLAALPAENGYRLRIDKVRFVGTRKAVSTMPPGFPIEALRMRVNAAVLVAVRVDAEGNVLEAMVAQSSMSGSRGTELRGSAVRKKFEVASVEAAKRWKFEPADLAAGDPAETTLVLSVTFTTEGAGYLRGWRAAGAGPSNLIPWLPADKQQFDATGLKDGEALALDSPMRLKEAVEGKAL